MAHVSRPFQIFLVAFVLFVAVWFVALRDHSTTGAGSSSPVTAPAPPAPPGAKAHASTPARTAGTGANSSTAAVKTTAHTTTAKAGSTTVVHTTGPSKSSATTVVHTSAPSKSSATTVVHTSAPSKSSATTVVHTSAPSKSAATTVVHTNHSSAKVVHATTTTKVAAKPQAARTTAPTPAHAKPAPSAASKPASGIPPMQLAVERQLGQGKTVLILFWNPSGSDDALVRRELPAVQRSEHGTIAVHYASAEQVGEYGAVTHAVQVNQTPTLLIVEPHGQTTTITGLTEAFAIEQAISEARAAAAGSK